jgi:hypothetical protein
MVKEEDTFTCPPLVRANEEEDTYIRRRILTHAHRLSGLTRRRILTYGGGYLHMPTACQG